MESHSNGARPTGVRAALSPMDQPNFSRMPSTKDRMPRASARAAPTNRLPIWLAAADRLREGPVQEVAEDVADADAGADHAEGREAGADLFSCFRVHLSSKSCGEWLKEEGRLASVAVAEVDHIVEVDAGQNREHEGLQEGHQELERGQGRRCR